jgi:hypothetical protein
MTATSGRPYAIALAIDRDTMFRLPESARACRSPEQAIEREMERVATSSGARGHIWTSFVSETAQLQEGLAGSGARASL